MDDIAYMKKALILAAKGKGETSPNPMVGTVIVKNGKIIGQGYHKKYGGKHAEIMGGASEQPKMSEEDKELKDYMLSKVLRNRKEKAMAEEIKGEYNLSDEEAEVLDGLLDKLATNRE